VENEADLVFLKEYGVGGGSLQSSSRSPHGGISAASAATININCVEGESAAARRKETDLWQRQGPDQDGGRL